MTSAKKLIAVLYLVVVSILTAQSGHAQDPVDTTKQDMQARVAALSSPNGRRIGSAHIAAVSFLEKFYAAREYRPAWTSPESISGLEEVIAVSWMDGLQASDFHSETLGVNANTNNEQLTAVERDIVRTDAFIRLLYQLYFGKVDPERVDPSWNYKRRLLSGEAVEIITSAIETGGIARLAAFAGPQDLRYNQLRELLKKMVGYVQAGSWPQISTGTVLKPGDSDPRVTALRQRLSATGDYNFVDQVDAQVDAKDVYDERLQQAVETFQKQHGLDVDGIVGPTTLATLNVTPQQRVDQIRVNMERARWVLPALKGQRDLVVVNAAGFYLWLYFDGKKVWGTDVITGRPYHKTPVFTEQMSYIVLNPDWSVPRSITRNEIFPKAKADPAYLAARNYDLIDSSGKKVSATSLNWSTLSADKFTYRVVQRPGPTNALGLVKFIFPNKFNVYLHDTPSRQLFSKTGRAFSHGCIRVKDPLKLAELILGQRNGWSRSSIDQAIASGKQRRVNLKKPLKVAVLYWTVDPGIDGKISYYKDIYGRDSKILDALNAEFRIK